MHACMRLMDAQPFMEAVSEPNRLLMPAPFGLGTPQCGASGTHCGHCGSELRCRNLTVSDLGTWKATTRSAQRELARMCAHAGSTCSLILAPLHHRPASINASLARDRMSVSPEEPDAARLVIREGSQPVALGGRTSLHVQAWDQSWELSQGRPGQINSSQLESGQLESRRHKHTVALLCPSILGPGIKPAGPCYTAPPIDGVLRFSPHTAHAVRTTRHAARLVAARICKRTVEYEMGSCQQAGAAGGMDKVSK